MRWRSSMSPLPFASFQPERSPDIPIDRLGFANGKVTRLDAVHKQNEVLTPPPRAGSQYPVEAQKERRITDFLAALIAEIAISFRRYAQSSHG